MRALRFGLAGTFAIVEAVAAAALVISSDHDTQPWLTAGFAITAGLSFVTAGLVALWRRPGNATGAWLAATGYLWFVGALSESDNPSAWTAGFILGSLAFVSFAALILAYPDGRLSVRARAIVAIGGLATIGGNVLLALFDTSPATNCDRCPESALAVTDSATVADIVSAVSTVVIVGVLAAVGGILVSRWRQASATSRRALRPVYLSCGISVALLLFAVAIDRFASRAYSVIWVLFLLSFALVPLSFLAGVLRSHLDQSSAAKMLVSLDEGISLRDALAQALHDASLEIVYWIESRGLWIDELGREVATPVTSATRSVTTIERSGQRIAALVHDPALDDEPGLVELIAAGAGLPLENVRLQAELRAQYLFLETIANTVPSLLVVTDLEGRILNQNQATLAASGLRGEEEIRDRAFWDVFIDDEERDAVLGRFRDAAPDFPAAQYENTFTNARGERRAIEWRMAPVTDAAGHVTSIVGGGVDITERKNHEEEIRASRARIIEAAGEARRKLERNLHDGAQQRLVSLSVSLRLAQSLLQSDPAGAERMITGAREELAAALDELRELARGIHPAVLTDRGLAAAVEALVTRTPLPIDLEISSNRLPAAIEAAAYYVISEAVTNVVRYAQASTVAVTVETDEDCVRVRVADDGVGGANPAAGTGLSGLRDRVSALDGTLTVDSPTGGGTRITAEIPARGRAIASVDSSS